MARPDKAAAVAELTNRFTNSNGAVLTEYRGLTVAAMKTLRRSLGEDATYAVSKNTLTKIAAKQAGIDGIDQHLVGPTAIAFIDGDPVNVAKGLRDFAKANPLLVIKAGVLDGNVLSSTEVGKLADLESREVLLAKLAGGMLNALQGAASLFAAPLSQAARVLGALQTAANDNPDLIGGAGTAAPETAGESEASASPVASASPEAPAESEAAPAADETTDAAAAAAEDK